MMLDLEHMDDESLNRLREITRGWALKREARKKKTPDHVLGASHRWSEPLSTCALH